MENQQNYEYDDHSMQTSRAHQLVKYVYIIICVAYVCTFTHITYRYFTNKTKNKIKMKKLK